MDSHLMRYLKEHSITYRLYTHKAVFTVAESQSDRDILNIPGLRCKTLFLRDEKNQFYLIGMPGTKRLGYGKLRKELGVKGLTMGSPEELLRETGLVPGSVSILCAFSKPLIFLIIDSEVWNADKVCFHPNINTESLEIPHNSLVRYYESLPNKKAIIAL